MAPPAYGSTIGSARPPPNHYARLRRKHLPGLKPSYAAGLKSKEGLGQFVKRRQLKAVTNTFYGTILLEEWNLNVITRSGWMEGDLLDFAMSGYYMDKTKSSISASVYLLKASGNLALRVSGLLLCLSAAFVLTPLFFADCFGCSY